MDERRFIINAPFGNYFHARDAISTYGTFTTQRRPGRIKQFVRTVRPVNGGWINQIGLRNPGVGYLIEHPPFATPQSIVSIHGFSTSDWDEVMSMAASLGRNQLIELNASCPNVSDDNIDYAKVFHRAVALFDRSIVKIGPTEADYHRVAQAICEGISRVHCGNTWPSPVGGISGPPLKPYSIAMVRKVREGAPPETVIIGSGGILAIKDIDDYWSAGADYVGCASLFLLPWRARRIKALAEYARVTYPKRTMHGVL